MTVPPAAPFHPPEAPEDFDVVVVGAGFGGLATALRLSELGAKVAVCEALNYPGGCAATYTHAGHRFEAGATLFSGFGPGQLFRRIIDRYVLDVDVETLDPVVELRTPGFAIPIPPDRERLVRRFLEFPEAPRDRIQAFFAEQRSVADTLWGVLDDLELLPPFGVGALVRHAARIPRYLPLLRLLGRPAEAVLARHGLEGFTPLRVYLDALCQITVQAGVAEAEAPFALSTMDYYFRGTGHVKGGIGALAWGLAGAIERNGGSVKFANRVRGLHRDADGWRVETRRGPLRARRVAANVLPQDLRALAGIRPGQNRLLDELAREVESGWSAGMIYRVLRHGGSMSRGARHLQLVQDPSRPLREGNNLFCSVSEAHAAGEGPGVGSDASPRRGGGAPGEKAGDSAEVHSLTVSTHIPMPEFRRLPETEQAARIDAVHRRMREGLATLAPELEEAIVMEMTASPRTFERFTRRHEGYVGGIPRRAGLRNYRRLGPQEVERGLYLVGDTVFPGQSTLATAVGGFKLAEVMARGRRSPW